eukprot:jgi/Tetstr1/423504/TSEL_014180.t1
MGEGYTRVADRWARVTDGPNWHGAWDDSDLLGLPAAQQPRTARRVSYEYEYREWRRPSTRECQREEAALEITVAFTMGGSLPCKLSSAPSITGSLDTSPSNRLHNRPARRAARQARLAPTRQPGSRFGCGAVAAAAAAAGCVSRPEDRRAMPRQAGRAALFAVTTGRGSHRRLGSNSWSTMADEAVPGVQYAGAEGTEVKVLSEEDGALETEAPAAAHAAAAGSTDPLSLPPHGTEVFLGGVPRAASEDDVRQFCEQVVGGVAAIVGVDGGR